MSDMMNALRAQIDASREAESDRRRAERLAEAQYRAAHPYELPEGRRALAEERRRAVEAEAMALVRAEQDRTLVHPDASEELKDSIRISRATPEQAAELVAARQAERALEIRQQLADWINPLARERRAAAERAAGEAVLDELAAQITEARERRARIQAAIEDGPDAA